MARVDDTVSPDRRVPEGVQVAGIFDLLRLAELLGRNVDDVAAAARAGDPGAWADNRVFMGLTNRPEVEIPDAFYAGDLPRFGSLNEMMDRGPTLEEYLSGAPAGEMLGGALADYRVGRAPIANLGFTAGATEPTYVDLGDQGRRLLQQGFVVVDENVDPADVRSLMAHEGTHVAQQVLGSPQGSNIKDADLLSQYFSATGTGPVPNFRRELMSMVQPNQMGDVPTLAYLHSLGEAQARAAQRRAGNEGLLSMVPSREDYAFNPYNLPFRSDLVYENYPETLEAAKEWWRSGGWKDAQ